jgi:polar amino acid transport system substrate-binding protein
MYLKIIGSLLFLVCLSTQISAFQTITAVLAPRSALVKNPGSGLYIDFLKKIFPEDQYSLVLQYLPLNTALSMVEQGKADLCIDYLYDEERKGIIYSDEKLTAEKIEVLYAKASPVTWTGSEVLKDKKIGVFFSYDFDKRLNVPVKREEYRVLKLAMQQVLNQAMPFLIDFKWDIEKIAQDSFISLDDFNRNIVFEVDTHVAFTDSEQGRALKKIYEKRFEAIKEDGELEKLFTANAKELID